MGVSCCSARKKEVNNMDKEKQYVSCLNKKSENFDFDTLKEEELKDLILRENNEDSLDVLINLIHNESNIVIEGAFQKSSWLGKPENLGELALVKILVILKNKNEENINIETDKVESNLYKTIKQTHLVSELMYLLYSESHIKKDMSILILSEICIQDKITRLMMNKELFKKLFSHIDNLRNSKYKNYKEQITACLQIFRRIYVKSPSMRKTYLELGGFQLFYECISHNDADITLEVLYAIEDLIYVN
jgi:hypothetical protein